MTEAQHQAILMKTLIALSTPTSSLNFWGVLAQASWKFQARAHKTERIANTRHQIVFEAMASLKTQAKKSTVTPWKVKMQ